MFHIKHWRESLKIFILSVKSKFGGRIVTWLLSAMGRLPGVTAGRQASHRLQCSPNKILESGTLGGGMGLVLVDIVEERGLLGCSKPALPQSPGVAVSVTVSHIQKVPRNRGQPAMIYLSTMPAINTKC